MNNDQFRRLVLENSTSRSSATPRKDAATPTSLGSRMRSSIPMTPRTVVGTSGIDFARQVREANAPPQKKLRSIAAPKGTKLASGYIDRTQSRISTEEDDKASRVKSLEEMVKLGQMDYDTFERLRDEIVGGDVNNAHLVKGLDRKLLERARRGEDVYKKPEPKAVEKHDEKEEDEKEVDVEAAFDELEEQNVVPIQREKKKDEDQSKSIAGKKRTRDDILRALKASRQKAETEAAPALGSKFRKLGAQLQPGTSRIERDEKGREVLITVDNEGNVKRKVRKAKPNVAATSETAHKNGLLMPDKDAIPLGADAPIVPQQPALAEESSENEDVFEGVGAEYDPLGGIDDDDSDSSSVESGEEVDKPPKPKPKPDCKHSTSPAPTADDTATIMPPPPLPSKPRNYFNDKPSVPTENDRPSNPLKDPSVLAALRKVNSLRKSPKSDDSDSDAKEEARKLARRKAMLEVNDRDAEDMDLGFGSSRFEDQEEAEGKRFKLSRWEGGGGEEGGDGKDRGGQKQRKRGKKKKKGDKDSASDVLAVLERRNKG